MKTTLNKPNKIIRFFLPYTVCGLLLFYTGFGGCGGSSNTAGAPAGGIGSGGTSGSGGLPGGGTGGSSGSSGTGGGTSSNTSNQALTLPVIPTINASMKTRLRMILQTSAGMTNSPDVFSKIGDSITESGSFMQEVGCRTGREIMSTAATSSAPLEALIDFYRAHTLTVGTGTSACSDMNSFTRSSVSATAGWQSIALLTEPSPSTGETDFYPASCRSSHTVPLLCELSQIHPAVALIMIGTNDVDAGIDLTTFTNNLNTIITHTLNHGTIPVLSTIPPFLFEAVRGARVREFNNAIIQVAQTSNIPVWNYWRAMNDLGSTYHYGISDDGIHPSLYTVPGDTHSDDFSTNALHFGYNLRNYTGLQVLLKLKQVVLDNGAPDPS